MGGRKSGVVLLIVLGLLGALALLAGIVFTVVSLDLRNAGAYTRAAAAFAAADSGARYAFARARADVESGALGFVRNQERVSYTAPAGFQFDAVTNLVLLPDRRSYLVRVTGRAAGAARAVVELVATGRPAAPSMTVFGNLGVDLKPNAVVYSYRSSTVTAPAIGDNTREAAVGSNGVIGGRQDSVQGGKIYLGANAAGTPAAYSFEGATPATVEHIARIEPDPLGVVGGYLALRFAQVALTNNNSSVAGATRRGMVMTIDRALTLTAGDYYVDRIDLGQNRTEALTINAAAGPVNIYLTGSASMRSKAELVVNPPIPANFRIYSNSTLTLDMRPRTTFMGYVYAPLATVYMAPNSDMYGAVWANYLSVMPGGSFFCDADMLNRVIPGELAIRSWKEVR